MAAVDALIERCTFPAPGSAIDCAVSGGADSLALLVLGVHAGCVVHAIHVDHGLRPGSGAEAEVVAAAADRFGARFTSLSVEVGPGPNLEARARDARYGVLPPGVCTGHTADDQAETILLALLRGSGPAGMGGIRPSVQRPILGLRRHETEAVCRAVGLGPVHDSSNDDPRHRRNRIRHEVLPLLADVADRDLVPVLVRQGELFRDTAEVLVCAAASLDPTDTAALRAAPRAVAREAIRTWIRSAWGSPHPPDLAAVDRVLAVAALDIRATDVGSGWRVERTTGRLRLVAPPAGSAPAG
ncbi:MAG: tRNA lysidine(34) synthetase TilS [Acidimicrobiales bacterium]